MLVDLGVLEEFPSNRSPASSTGSSSCCPSLEDHACSLGRRGGFITRLRDGTWAGHVAEHIALELQNLAGTDVRHGKTRGAGAARPVQRHLRVPRGDGRHRGRQARRRARQPPRRPGRRPRLRLPRRARAADPARRAARPSGRRPRRSSTRRVSRDIPFIRLDRYSLVQLGQGVHQQRIRATMTSRTTAPSRSTSPATRA